MEQTHKKAAAYRDRQQPTCPAGKWTEITL